MLESLCAQMNLIIYWFPVARSMSDHGDIGSEYETDSDLEDEEEAGGSEAAENSVPESL